jgi:hypothetical protein
MRYLLFTLVLLGSLLPIVTYAAPFDSPIVPEVCQCEEEKSAPAYGCVLQTVQNIIRVGIALGFVMATLALMYAGFVWMTSGGNAERRSTGKNLLLNVVVGLAVMLCAWIIVDFVMKTLYDEKGEFGPWNDILAPEGDAGNKCLETSSTKALTKGALEAVLTTVGSNAYIGSGTGVKNPGASSDQDARKALTSAGISIHCDAGLCATKTLANTRNDTILQTVEIKRACNCNVIVTATTGGAHAGGPESHAAGYKVDLEDTRDLNLFLMKSLKKVEPRGSDPRYKDSCGNEYVLEKPGQNGNPGPKGSHWDITVNSGSCRLGG